MENQEHIPVLLTETIVALTANASHHSLTGVWVDGTFGRGGHSRSLLPYLSADAQLIVMDRDPTAIVAAEAFAQTDSRVIVRHRRFSDLEDVLFELGISEIQGLMVDIGVSSPQIDDAHRGFSFMREGTLDMRMNFQEGLTVGDWLMQASQTDIQEVIKYYGEERYAFQIAKAITARCAANGRIKTTIELAELVAGVIRSREKGQHPATRTFQALRIFINQELTEFSRLLEASLRCLAPGARLATISFHSREDRLVKQFLHYCSIEVSEGDKRLPIRQKDLPQPYFEKVGKWKASAGEVKNNPRSRSAILRVAQRTDRIDGLEEAIQACRQIESFQNIQRLQSKLNTTAT